MSFSLIWQKIIPVFAGEEANIYISEQFIRIMEKNLRIICSIRITYSYSIYNFILICSLLSRIMY